MSDLIKKFTKKSFNLALDTLDVPTAAEVQNAIQKYARESNGELVFIAEKMPIKFRLDGTVFVTHRGTSRGGPTISCVEE